MLKILLELIEAAHKNPLLAIVAVLLAVIIAGGTMYADDQSDRLQRIEHKQDTQGELMTNMKIQMDGSALNDSIVIRETLRQGRLYDTLESRVRTLEDYHR